MSTAKIAISIDTDLVKEIDQFIRYKVFKNRSQAIQVAVKRTLDRLRHKRLAIECAKLDPAYERKMAEEGLTKDFEEWPEY